MMRLLLGQLVSLGGNRPILVSPGDFPGHDSPFEQGYTGTMPEEKARYRRLFFVDQRIASRGFPNAVEMAAEYEVSARTIKRDIEFMRDSLGAPIEYDRFHNGYYYSESTWRLPALTITEHELFAVTLAANVLEAYRNSPIYGELARVFDKLSALLPEKVSVPIEWLQRRVSVFHTATTQIDPNTWDVVLRALRENTSIGFQYTAPRYKTSVGRIIDPYHCIGHGGEWYLIGRDRLKSEVRIYALSRMQKPRLARSQFKIPDDFDPSRWVDRHFGIFMDTETRDIRIRFAPHLAPYIRERLWHETQELEDQPDGMLELRFRTNQLDAVRYWSHSWGPGAVVLEPKELRQKVVDDLAASLRFYELDTPPPASRPV